jgi:hypothetical protein
MKDEFDNIVSGEAELVPSSGFVASEMDAVREEAAASQPIAFPWGRALPGLAALGVVLAMFIAAVVRLLRMPEATTSDALGWTVMSWAHGLLQSNTGWIVLALLLSLFSIFFTLRLARE